MLVLLCAVDLSYVTVPEGRLSLPAILGRAADGSANRGNVCIGLFSWMADVCRWKHSSCRYWSRWLQHLYSSNDVHLSYKAWNWMKLGGGRLPGESARCRTFRFNDAHWYACVYSFHDISDTVGKRTQFTDPGSWVTDHFGNKSKNCPTVCVIVTLANRSLQAFIGTQKLRSYALN